METAVETKQVNSADELDRIQLDEICKCAVCINEDAARYVLEVMKRSFGSKFMLTNLDELKSNQRAYIGFWGDWGGNIRPTPVFPEFKALDLFFKMADYAIPSMSGKDFRYYELKRLS